MACFGGSRWTALAKEATGKLRHHVHGYRDTTSEKNGRSHLYHFVENGSGHLSLNISEETGAAVTVTIFVLY